MTKYIVHGGKPLFGEVEISGAKNAAVAIIPAAILVDGVCRIENIPQISDVTAILKILEQLGASIRSINRHTVEIDSRHIHTTRTSYELSRKLRASYYLIGALLGRFGRAEVAMPGGCNFGGVRPIDQHVKGFSALGAGVTTEGGYINAIVESGRLTGANIYLDVVSVGATMNIMMAAALAQGDTVIENCAKEPHIVDLANFLNSMGADIRGAGTDTIKIRGVERLSGGSYAIIPDQIEAGTYLDAGSSQMGKKESLEDSAKVLGRFFDGIEYRGYEQSVVEDLAKWSGVPVWNGLTDADHPTQILADLMTIEEHCKKPLNKIKVVFPGDVRNNMCYAWMMGAAKLGMHFVAMGPEELAKQMDQEVVQSTFAEARKNGGLIEITDHAEDLKGADVIYGDVWASMGEEAQIPERVGLLSPFRVTMDTLKATENPDVLYLHCLPSFHDFETKMAKEWQAKGVDIREVTDEVFRSRHSVVFDEAENRMHSIKAVMVATIGA